jgi:ribosomal protein L11 methyltransferase
MSCPCAQLRIYQLDGRLDSRVAIPDARFLGHWPEGDTSGLFFSARADEAIAGLLRAYPHLRLAERTRMPYEQWQGAIAAAERVGPFRIVPAWAPSAARDAADPLTLVIDPGVVFGAGNHPTTRDCLLAIDRAAAEGGFRSGVTTGEAEGVRRRLSALGVTVRHAWTRDGVWHTFLAAR